MVRICLAIILAFLSGRSFGQQDYSILIQSDNNQPFYARIGDKSSSSSPQGRLLLSSLRDSTYTVKLWFLQQGAVEQQFVIKADTNKRLWVLRDFGDKGLGLYNTQTQVLTMSLSLADKQPDSSLYPVRSDSILKPVMADTLSNPNTVNTAIPATGMTEPANNPVKIDSVKDRSALTDKSNEAGRWQGASSRVYVMGTKKDDAFSRLMAGVVGDTAVMYNTYVLEDSPKDTPVSAPIVNNSAAAPSGGASSNLAPATVVATTAASATPEAPSVTSAAVTSKSLVSDSASEGAKLVSSVASSPVANTGDSSKTGGANAAPVVAVHAVSTVHKISERHTAKSVRMVFADHIKGRRADTIIVIIPLDTAGASMAIQNRHNDTPAGQSSSSSIEAASIQQPSSQNGKEQTSSSPVVAANTAPSGSNASSEPLYRPKMDTNGKRNTTKPVLINTDCKNFASDYDVDKLRVKMLDAKNDEDKIQTAKKVFKTKCFTTKQIRALSELFTADVYKFKFFESAYPFVSDEQFSKLADLLTDPVYNNKFKLMTNPR